MRLNKIFHIMTIILALMCRPGWCETNLKYHFNYSGENVTNIDFTDFSKGSVEEWLHHKGFKLQKDARFSSKIGLSADDGSLVVQTKTQAFGMIMNKGIDIRKYRFIRINWGVIQYPQDASWEHKRKNEALSVMVFFGYEKIDSGSVFIPDTPYFIALFLGPDEVLGKAYSAKHFNQSGRWVCLGNPIPGKTITSEFNLLEAYRKIFNKNDTPVISAVAVSIDTSNSGNNGNALSYINKIQFFE